MNVTLILKFVRLVQYNSLSARERECQHEEGENQSVHSRSFQFSAVHGRFREIRQCMQHCLCLNQLYNYREDIYLRV